MIGFIQKISIEKILHLKNIDIELDSQSAKHLILTGKNGSGKTTVLNKIRDFLNAIPNKHITSLTQEKNYSPNAKKVFSKYQEGIYVHLNSPSFISERYDSGRFILAHFAATRNVAMSVPHHVSKIDLQDTYPIHVNLTSSFLNYLVYLKTQQSFAVNEGDVEESQKIQIWFNRFEAALKDLFEDNSIQLKFDYKNLNFLIHQHHRSPYTFNTLSDGYSSILDIVINLILRMEKTKRNAYDVEGIVLIDEIENHLHIELQKKVLPFLTSFFPNIQFIVTTHSPFVITSIDHAVLYDLETKDRLEDLSGYTYGGIVEGYFNMDQYSNEVKKKLIHYERLVFKKVLTQEEEDEAYSLRKYLKDISPQFAPDVDAAFKRIEFERKSQKSVNR